MHVVATAGHVDHGKSTLVRALTGTDPDRLEEERRRGLTIELGFAWTTVAGHEIAFVDVPGHQRFLATMLAGVGPVPAALLVVSADEGWRRQSAEHLAALVALDVQHAVVAITRSDLADPAAAAEQVAVELTGTALAGSPCLPVSAVTGAGLPELRTELARLAACLPTPDPLARVRLWADRVFTVDGTGTVVTGTLAAGRLRLGDELEVGGRRVRVRGLESLGVAREEVSATARVAVALRGVERGALRRGDALLAPGGWSPTAAVDVRLSVPAADLRGQLVLHVGAAATTVRVRPLAGGFARVLLARPLPLQPGDRALLRDPGRQTVAAGVVVLDADPPPLVRRGAARARAGSLAALGGAVDAAAEVDRRGVVTRQTLAAAGVLGRDAPLPAGVVAVGELLVARGRWEAWARDLTAAVRGHAERDPLALGVPRERVRASLGAPPAAFDRLLDETLEVVVVAGGRLVPAGARPALPAPVAVALAQLERQWHEAPLVAPGAEELLALGLTPAVLGALAAGRRLLRLPGDVVLPPDAVDRASTVLRTLPQPFTVSAAREALGTSRRVAVPLLEHLDATRVTRRLDAGTRVLR